MSLQNSHQISEIKVLLKKGADGAGIANIELTGTSGIVDTYTITLTNGDKYTFTVTNGSSIASIEKTGTSGNVDTYTITLTNGDTYTFTVTNATGSSADGITYDNTDSGLTATNVQDAIDEIVALITALSASDVSYDNSTSGLNATKVQGAIDEVVEMTKHGIVELWTNPSPSNSYAGQTLTISQSDLDARGLAVDINDIDAVDVEFEVSGISISTMRGRIGAQMQPAYMSINGNGKILWYLRACTISRANNTISIEFRDCTQYTLNSYGVAPTTGTTNNYLVPTIITGLIHNS